MKAIILISSIFYIIGLKVSSQIDLAGKSNQVDTLISDKIIPHQPAKAVQILQSDEKVTEIDSLKEETVKEEDNQS